MHSKNICIVGSGVIGLSTAFMLATDNPNCSLHIISDASFENPCSEHSSGSIWAPEPTIPGFYSPRDGARTIETFKWAMKILTYNTELAEKMGLKLNKGYHVLDANHGTRELEDPVFQKTVVDLRPATTEEIEKQGFLNDPHKFNRLFGRDGVKREDILVYHYGMVVFDTKFYLPWLLEQLKQMETTGMINKLKFSNIKLKSLHEVCACAEYDVVANCSGMGAKELCNDAKMIPIRGQYLLCKMPSKDFPWLASFDPFIAPLMDRVFVGVIFQRGRTDVTIDQRDTNELIEKASILWPEVANHVFHVGAAIRPGRLGGSRVDEELINGTLFIHNYGHGSKGVNTHWACAKEVASMFRKITTASSL